MKEFVFVKFAKGGTADVVHRSWMLGTDTCLWPNRGNGGDLARKKTAPEGN